MSALTFTLKSIPQQRIDLSPLTPHALASMPLAEIGAIELIAGRRKVRADSVFDISGDDADDIVIANSCDKLDYIGHDMKHGRITVHGNAGDYLGLKLRHGEIVVHGNAGIFAASGMAGGFMHIHGNAGDRVGDQMRRGLLLIEGDAGNYCASRMLAGTIGVGGQVGEYAGYGMRRGTLLLTRAPALHATIRDCGPHTLPFLSLMFKSFAQLPSRFAQINKNRVQRYAGDIANDGKGEILVLL